MLSDGQEFDSELILWTADNVPNLVVHRHTDLPIDVAVRPVSGAVATPALGRGVLQYRRIVVKGFLA